MGEASCSFQLFSSHIIVNAMYEENLWEVDEEMMAMFDSDDDEFLGFTQKDLNWVSNFECTGKNWFVTCFTLEEQKRFFDNQT